MDNDQTLRHLAIIMDGNGRWALNQDLPRTAGHAAGEGSLSLTIDWAIENSICLLYTSPSPRDGSISRMPSSA